MSSKKPQFSIKNESKSGPKRSRFVWNESKTRAAQLTAEAKLTEREIAPLLGIARSTLIRWKEEPEFQARVAEINLSTAQALQGEGIRSKSYLLDALQDRIDRMKEVIRQRAAYEPLQKVPGWNQGILIHQEKRIGKGDEAEIIDIYPVDTNLLKELREHEKQAAILIGEWQERTIQSGSVISIDLGELTDSQLNEFERLISEGIREQQAYVMARKS